MAEQNIEGLDELLSQLNNLRSIDVVATATVGGYVLLAESQKLCPVDTGFLRNSGFIEEVKGQGVNMIFSAEYAFYVEFDKHPFVRPAMDQSGELIIKAMKDEADRQVKEAIGK